MDVKDINDLEQFSAIIINELQTFGVKYRKPKMKKIQKKSVGKNIFFANLNVLGLTEVILSNGKVVEIPQFVAEACNRILEQVETEGIFRKAGSFVRQKEIRESLEAGLPLGKSHHVIDVANVIKYFFRELPEPLIPPFLQETLLGCLQVGVNSVKAIILACLLLPPLTINTLSFFMQFLYTVSLSENCNKMSVESLAIIFTPGLMPYPNVNNLRFANHVKIIRILIENANNIGTIPRNIELKLHENLKKLTLAGNRSGHTALSAKKGKKRHSDIFYGLRKIVGTTGISQCLDDTIYDKKCRSKHDEPSNEENMNLMTATPCVKESKKRSLVPFSAFSSKKKGTPKKSRLSLPVWRHSQNISLRSTVTYTERKWSILEPEIGGDKKSDDAVTSNLHLQVDKTCKFSTYPFIKESTDHSVDQSSCTEIKKEKSVAPIKKLISNEIIAVPNPKIEGNSADSSHVNQIQPHYEQMATQTNALSSLATEHLYKSINLDINMRRSIDQRFIRSPNSAKKVTTRRKLQDKYRLSRNYSWHTMLSSDFAISKRPIPFKYRQNYSNENLCTHKNIQKSINVSTSYSTIRSELKISLGSILSDEGLNVHWMSGENSLSDKQIKEPAKTVSDCFNEIHVKHRGIPARRQKNIDTEKTPMLLPKSLSNIYIRTPLNNDKKSPSNKFLCFDHTAASILENEETNVRTSIARLRAKNAGMVLAKAKLFDGLEKRNKEDLLCFKNVLSSKQNNIDLKEYT